MDFRQNRLKKVLVILGPTATGKTDVALQLAHKFQGELVSCDSRQVYTGLDIGTGKLPSQNSKVDFKKFEKFWMMDGVKIWMYDVVSPNIQFTVKDYVEQAEKVIEDIIKRGKLPIIVGGTGLYLKALTQGLSNLNIPVDEKLRGELQKLSLGELQNKLQELSPANWENLNQSDRGNKRRLLRSIELIYMNPRLPKTEQGDGGQAYMVTQTQNGLIKKYDILKIGLTAPREVLNKKIDLRLISRLDQGMIEEARELYKNGLTLQRMKELGLEYGLLADLLADKINKEQFIEQLKTKIHQFAKRQVTWFKKEKDVAWLDVSISNAFNEVEKIVSKWYHKADN